MTTNEPVLTTEKVVRRKSGIWRWLLFLLIIWGAAAYLLVPLLWKRHFQHAPQLADAPRITHTSDDHPGDPLNLALLGSEVEVIRAMTGSGWFPADPITFESSVRIALDSVFRKPDPNAPVSNLYLFGRKQDLAFERPVGNSPRQRHHVRFWKWDKLYEGQTAWFGAATLDTSVGLSYTTAQVTHHIGPLVDAERDGIMSDLKKSGWSQTEELLVGFHKQLEGRNGGGDVWRTDGQLGLVFLKTNGIPGAALKH